MTENNRTNLHFAVSSGLKSVLGGELITDDEVAIFELVKNAFDADADQVHLFFDADKIVIVDNGSGMSKADLENKWLFVAYSSKRAPNSSASFRDEISQRRQYAGSKGIGRFSSDRLGEEVELQTRPQSEKNGPVHIITVDWSKFDANPHQRFEKIGVRYESRRSGFTLPVGLPKVPHGTAISILKTRRQWDRSKILNLKSALAKLINPFGATTDGFRIVVHAPAERDADSAVQAQALKKGSEQNLNSVVNGEVGNFIFSTLQEKTTFIDMRVEGQRIETSLTDRGELIYQVREPNPYPLLANSGFECQIFFLNTSAKLTFAKRMGVPSVQFGSVFLFRNGFRVFPIGEEGDDWFGMDRRKGQGYARFLGTRDIIGRIDVSGADGDFQETSSRNTGLIETPAVIQLKKCFMEHCLKRLERYVVPVTFVDREDRNTSDVSRLLTDPGRARVAAVIAKLVDHDDVELVTYSKRLVGILDERSAQFEGSLASLRAIAQKTEDGNFFAAIEKAERRFDELRRSEEAARHLADEERKAKEEAETRAAKAETFAKRVSTELGEEKKRNLFLSSIATLDTDTILNLHHQVTIYAVDINQQIENFLIEISGRDLVPRAMVLDAFERITLLNRKVKGISQFATKANFRLEAEGIDASLGDYIEQYINDVARIFLHGPLVLQVSNDQKGFVQRFKPIDISVVIDNLVSNARRARATNMAFAITHPTKDTIHVRVSDNGRGFSSQIDDLERVFEKGFTMTEGSGLGLYHVRHVLGQMGGTIEPSRPISGTGAVFLIRISK